MTGFEAYKMYLALRLHFTSPGYDYFKYNGKVKADVSSYETRKDRIFFEKMAKHPDLMNHIVANLSLNPKAYFRDIAYSEEAKRNYDRWAARNQSITYHFTNELGRLDENFAKNFSCDNGHPILLKLLMRDDISIETVSILCKVTNCFRYWDKKIGDDVVYTDMKTKIMKYIPFVVFDPEKIKNVLKSKFNIDTNVAA